MLSGESGLSTLVVLGGETTGSTCQAKSVGLASLIGAKDFSWGLRT